MTDWRWWVARAPAGLVAGLLFWNDSHLWGLAMMIGNALSWSAIETHTRWKARQAVPPAVSEEGR